MSASIGSKELERLKLEKAVMNNDEWILCAHYLRLYSVFVMKLMSFLSSFGEALEMEVHTKW